MVARLSITSHVGNIFLKIRTHSANRLLIEIGVIENMTDNQQTNHCVGVFSAIDLVCKSSKLRVLIGRANGDETKARLFNRVAKSLMNVRSLAAKLKAIPSEIVVDDLLANFEIEDDIRKRGQIEMCWNFQVLSRRYRGYIRMWRKKKRS